MQSLSQQQKANGNGFPKLMWSEEGGPPVTVQTPDDQKKLGPGWYSEYRHQEYPKTMYKKGVAKIQPAIVKQDGTVVREEAVIHVKLVVNSLKEEHAAAREYTDIPPDPWEKAEPEFMQSPEQVEAERESLKKKHAEEVEGLKAQLAAFHAKQAAAGAQKESKG